MCTLVATNKGFEAADEILNRRHNVEAKIARHGEIGIVAVVINVANRGTDITHSGELKVDRPSRNSGELKSSTCNTPGSIEGSGDKILTCQKVLGGLGRLTLSDTSVWLMSEV